jgi:hypothetical protein
MIPDSSGAYYLIVHDKGNTHFTSKFCAGVDWAISIQTDDINMLTQMKNVWYQAGQKPCLGHRIYRRQRL